jgi:chitodextrinase
VAPVELTVTPRLLRVARGDGNYLYLEFRQPSGAYDAFGASDPAVNGVIVRLAPDLNVRTQSLLLDTTPSTSSFADAPLAAGMTFTDGVTGISITTVSVSSTGATVQVSFAADESPPSQPGSLAAPALDPYRVGLAWSASTDNVGVAGYRVYRDGVLRATVTGTGYTDTGLSPQTTYGYTVVAFDAAGNVSPSAAASATTPAPDTTAPTAPTGLTAQKGKGKKVVLSWGASTDDVAVTGYRVFRNGTLVGTTTATSYTDTLPGKVTSATYVVKAFDAAGNESAPSAGAAV